MGCERCHQSEIEQIDALCSLRQTNGLRMENSKGHLVSRRSALTNKHPNEWTL